MPLGAIPLPQTRVLKSRHEPLPRSGTGSAQIVEVEDEIRSSIIEHQSPRVDFKYGIAPGPVGHAVYGDCPDASGTRPRVRIVERWARKTGDPRLRQDHDRPRKPEVCDA